MSCMTPVAVKHKITGKWDCFPCGKCPNCMKRRISGWSFRLMQEDKRSSSAHFLTLTYDTEHVHITKNGFMSLSKRDCQLFFKRLRKLNTEKLKYYLCGEYGGKTKRPHYHVILFNCDMKTIQTAWQVGSVHYGKVSAASVGYTLKYMSKSSKIPMHINDDRQPEFSLMSKGLGSNYLTDAKCAWHKNDLENRMYCNVERKKIAMPRYYKDKIYNEQERKVIAHKFKHLVEKELQEQFEKSPEDKRALIEAHKSAFTRMHMNATLSRNKI